MSPVGPYGGIWEVVMSPMGTYGGIWEDCLLPMLPSGGIWEVYVAYVTLWRHMRSLCRLCFLTGVYGNGKLVPYLWDLIGVNGKLVCHLRDLMGVYGKLLFQLWGYRPCVVLWEAGMSPMEPLGGKWEVCLLLMLPSGGIWEVSVAYVTL